MIVERDELWYSLFKSFAKLDPEDQTRQANACWKAKKLYEILDSQKAKTKIIIKAVPNEHRKPTVARKCQAVNMSGKPCQFKATCGNFCKKHKVSDKNLSLDAKRPEDLCLLIEDGED